jgi:ferredoxin
MAHRTVKSSYEELTRRLNRFPVGAPPSDLLYRILSLLFTEDEAQLAAKLPVTPFTAEQAARAWKTSPREAERILDGLADRSLIVDTGANGSRLFFLPPPMAGFFEFSMMRTDGGVDRKALSELFYQYMNVEEDFVRNLYEPFDTQLGRALVHEPALSPDNDLHVLDYERATEVIATATHIGVGACYCRHKMDHLGRACDAPMETCMALNAAGECLTRQGAARRIDAIEALELLQQAYDHGLVQFAENVRHGVNFICHCCSCCCETMVAARRFSNLRPVHTTRFLPVVDHDRCTGCGACVGACPVAAVSVDPVRSHRRDPAAKQAVVDASTCIGCGVCVRACRRGSLSLTTRKGRIVTPLDSAHRTVLMAIESGTLQNLVFSEATTSHRALAAILGVVLKLPPVKQVMATEQLRSRYLESLFSRRSYWGSTS